MSDCLQSLVSRVSQVFVRLSHFGLRFCSACGLYSRSLCRLRPWSREQARHQTASLQLRTFLTSSRRSSWLVCGIFVLSHTVQDVPRRPSFSPRVSEDAVTASLPASLSTALVQAREARAAATAERAERTERVSGSRSTSKDSVRTDLSMNVDWASSKAKDGCSREEVLCCQQVRAHGLCEKCCFRLKDMFRKGVMSSKEEALSHTPLVDIQRSGCRMRLTCLARPPLGLLHHLLVPGTEPCDMRMANKWQTSGFGT